MNCALLVGINKYKSLNTKNLNGCRNDVLLVEAYLRSSMTPEFSIAKLYCKDASRKNVIAGIRTHLGSVKAGEIALFYFSGHGAKQRSPDEFIRYQQDEFHENIVCHDSGVDAEYLADKELKFLFEEIAARGAEVVVILDCCHSGSGLRAFEAIKHRPKVQEARPLETFLEGSTVNLASVPPYRFLAASGPREYSIEKRLGPLGDQKPHGVFTYALIETLKQKGIDGRISYANLTEAVRLGVRWLLPGTIRQTPRLEITGDLSGNVHFLHHEYEENPDSFLVNWDSRMGSWVINAGIIHGLMAGQKARFNIVTTKDGEETQIGIASTRSIGLVQSPLDIQFQQHFLPIKSQSYHALTVYIERDRVPVYDPDHMLWQPRSAGDEETAPDSSSSIALLKVLGSGLHAELFSKVQASIHRQGTQYGVRVVGDICEIFFSETGHTIAEVPVSGSTIRSSAQQIALYLIQIADWERAKLLDNPASMLWREVNNISFTIYESSKPHQRNAEFLTIDYDPSQQKIPIELEVQNNSRRALSMKPLYLSRFFQVINGIEHKMVQHDNRAVILDEAQLHIPNNEDGFPLQVFDLYQIVVSKEEISYFRIGSPKRIYSPQSKDLEMRDMGRDMEADFSNHWFTHAIRVKVLQTLGKIGREPLRLSKPNLEFEAHPVFRASVSISSCATQVEPPLSDMYIKWVVEKSPYQLLDFSGGNLETQIEIHHIENPESLSDQPLRLTLTQKIPEGFSLLAVTLPPFIRPDSDTYGKLVFLGWWQPLEGNKYRLSLDDIPENPADGRIIPEKSVKIASILIPSAQCPDIQTILPLLIKDK